MAESNISFYETNICKAIDKDDSQLLNDCAKLNENFLLQNEKGESYLIYAAKRNASKDVFRILLPLSDLSERDENSNCILDIGKDDSNVPNWVEGEVRDYLTKNIAEMDQSRLENLVLRSWSFFPLDDSENIRAKNPEAADIIEKVQEIEEKIKSINNAIVDGDAHDVFSNMDRKQLAMSRDVTGLSPLQKSVILEETEITRRISELFPTSINVQDNMGRTALHYAAAQRDGGHVYKFLVNAGADETIEDVKQQTPKYYRENPSLIPVKDIQKSIRSMYDSPRMRPISRPSTGISGASSINKGVDPNDFLESEKTLDSKPFEDNAPRAGAEARIQEGLRGASVVTDMHTKKNVPPPEGPDAKYVAEKLGNPLTLGLAELCQKQPWDPIEFLAHFLYKYADNVSFAQEKKRLIKEIEEDHVNEKLKQEMDEKCKEEAEKFVEEEKQKREAEELARLEAERKLVEEREEERLALLREEEEKMKQRCNDLHAAVTRQSEDLREIMEKDPTLLAGLNSEGSTARELAVSSNSHASVKVIDDFVISLVTTNNQSALEDLVLRNYNDIPDLDAALQEEQVEESTREFIGKIPEVKKQMAELKSALLNGIDRDVRSAISNKSLLKMVDDRGANVLHLAVMGESTSLVRYLIEQQDSLVHGKDINGRTPLHYAAALRDGGHVYKILLEHAAGDVGVSDLDGKTPENFLENPGSFDLKELKSKVYGISDESEKPKEDPNSVLDSKANESTEEREDVEEEEEAN